MNFWKQMTHVMSYFKEENFRGDKRLPSNFMEGFLEVRFPVLRPSRDARYANMGQYRAGIRVKGEVPTLCTYNHGACLP